MAYLTQQRMAGEFAEVFTALMDNRPVSTRHCPPWREEGNNAHEDGGERHAPNP